MYSYDTLSEALEDLAKRGYTQDFNLLESCIECTDPKKKISPDSFKIVEVYRFEGMTSTDDESILFAIETDDGLKGTMVDAYGTYAHSLSPEMIKKLQYKTTP